MVKIWQYFFVFSMLLIGAVVGITTAIISIFDPSPEKVKVNGILRQGK
jgi:ribosomal protein L7Ae-like RNA K-turn-binding protein